MSSFSPIRFGRLWDEFCFSNDKSVEKSEEEIDWGNNQNNNEQEYLDNDPIEENEDNGDDKQDSGSRF